MFLDFARPCFPARRPPPLTVSVTCVQYGAELQWLSAFPDESEVLYPPLTYLRPTGNVSKVAVKGGACVTAERIASQRYQLRSADVRDAEQLCMHRLAREAQRMRRDGRKEAVL